jgi:hypothetical protein
MNVATNDNWSFGLMHVGFFEEELLNFVAQSTHASFVQAFALFESCDPLVHFGHMYFKFFIVFESVINEAYNLFMKNTKIFLMSSSIKLLK